MLGHSCFKPFGRWVGPPCQVRYSPKAARQPGRGARQKADNFLPKPLARGIVFQKSAAPRPAGFSSGAGRMRFGGGAKRNGVDAIENNEFREMPHFAPLMGSRAYACVAKSFASLREMNPSASPSSARWRRPKTRFATRETGLRAGSEGRTTVPTARQVAEIVETELKMAPRPADAREPIGRTPYHADGRGVRPYAAPRQADRGGTTMNVQAKETSKPRPIRWR